MDDGLHVNGGPVSLWLWLVGCAVHRVGLVDVAPEPSLTSAEGGRERLVLVGEGPRRLGHLEAHLVEVEARRAGGRLTVSSFRVLEGPHGMPVWFGPVQVLGSQVAIADLASGGTVLVDDAAAAELRSLAGAWVAIEGYVEGPQRIRVLDLTVAE